MPFHVGSGGMVPTPKAWDRVLVDKPAYDFAEPEREDVVLLHGVEGGEESRQNAWSGCRATG